MRWRVLAVALLAATAGCNAIEGSGETTLTPAPVPSDVPEEGPGSMLAPGVWADGRVDPGRLAETQQAVLENRSFRWLSTRNWSGQVGNLTTKSNSHHLIVFENGTHYYRDTDWIVDHRSEHVYARISEYANGTHRFVRARAFTATGTKYERTEASSATYRLVRMTTMVVEKHLQVESSTIERVTVDGRTRVRIVGRGGAGVWSDKVRNYTVRALVTPTGMVTELSARYRVVTGGATESVHYRFTFQKLGDVTVPRPDWLTEARNRIANGTNDFSS